ncbi:hypothetical protein BDV93DRAFT_577218 [Ceratobasidium sp. AG-I]|nr:hypothetical protein BDV93DRAFT_577218 [Ceratobasidium sp. AG-I]
MVISHITLLSYSTMPGNTTSSCFVTPHTAHIFQGLDVTCFGRLKELYSQYAGEYEDTTGQRMTKDVFLTPFSRAYVETFTKETISSAFRSTGVHPFNRNILTSSNMAPSLPTSVQSGLPIHLPDAVSVMARIWDNTWHVGSHLRFGGAQMNIGLGTDGQGDGSSDVEMQSEGGRVDSMEDDGEEEGEEEGGEEEGGREEGGEHTNRDNEKLAITSHNRLEPLPFYHFPPALPTIPRVGVPGSQRELDLEQQNKEFRRREKEIGAVYRGAQAQLVLVDRHCGLLQSQLNAKESKEEARQQGRGKARLMGDGLPKVLTQGAIYEQARKNREIEKAEQEAKQQRETRNAELKRMKETWSEQERARKEGDKMARRQWEEGPLAEWEAEKAARQAEGRRARWARPKPPKRSKPLPKPSLTQGGMVEEVGVAEVVVESDGDEGDASESEGERGSEEECDMDEHE